MVILGFLSLASTVSKHTFPQVAEVSRIARSDTDTDKNKTVYDTLLVEYSDFGNSCGGTDALRKFLDAVPSIRIIHIQPLRDRIGHQRCGGRLAEARKLRDFIRERKLVTYIGPPGPPPAMLAIGLTDTPCAAACRVAFMGGVQRFMAPEAKLGFHRGSFPGITDEELAQEDEELAQENEAGRRGSFGVWVRAWFANRAEPTAGDSMWWLTSEELRQTGVITGVASLNDLEVWLRQGTL
jgi:hypothetical protein